MCADESRIAHFMCVVKTKKKKHDIISTEYLTQVKGVHIVDLREQLKKYAIEQDTTLKDVILSTDLNYNNIINKFKRNTIRVAELKQILDVLGKDIQIVDKHDK